MSYSLLAGYRLNNFVTETNWLPRADHFWLGQPLAAEHAHLVRTHERRLCPIPAVERAAEPGARRALQLPALGTVQRARPAPRHAAGASTGPSSSAWSRPCPTSWARRPTGAKTRPANRYAAVGSGGHPGHAADVERRSTVSDDLLNIHGIAHKVTFDFEFSAAGADQDLNQLPLYDPLND